MQAARNGVSRTAFTNRVWEPERQSWGTREDKPTLGPFDMHNLRCPFSGPFPDGYEELTMRSGSSTKRLRLDDPLIDAQRNAALEALTEMPNRKVRAQTE